MTKADIVARIAQQTGVEKAVAMTVVEAFMETVKDSMVAGDEVFLRGFGSFIIKKRAKEFFYRRYQGFNTLIIRI